MCGGNTVDFFDDLNSLKYVASPTLKKAVDYADEDSGWVRYKDVVDIFNEKAEEQCKTDKAFMAKQEELIGMKEILFEFGNRLANIEKSQQEIIRKPSFTKDDVNNMFRVEGNTLFIGSND